MKPDYDIPKEKDRQKQYDADLAEALEAGWHKTPTEAINAGEAIKAEGAPSDAESAEQLAALDEATKELEARIEAIEGDSGETLEDLWAGANAKINELETAREAGEANVADLDAKLAEAKTKLKTATDEVKDLKKAAKEAEKASAATIKELEAKVAELSNDTDAKQEG